MLIKDSGVATNIVDQVLESSLQKLGVVVYKSDSSDSTWANLSGISISITRIKKGGQSTPILYPTPLDLVLEMNAAYQGHVGNPSFTLRTQIVGTIDISNFGTLSLQDEVITVSVTGVPANTGVKIFSIEGDALTESSIEYQPNVALADTPKKVVVADCHRLALPITGIQKLILDYADGRTATYQSDELGMICKDMNDLVTVEYTTADAGKAVVSYGYKFLYVLDIADVLTMTVHYTAQTKFWTIRNT